MRPSLPPLLTCLLAALPALLSAGCSPATPSAHAAELKPSPRGELEITDLNKRYLAEGNLHLEALGRGYAWLDTGTHQSLLEASNFIETIQTRQGLQVCCPEEIAFGKGWINAGQLETLAAPLSKNAYGQYLLSLIHRGVVR